jgi:hypothetical protein
MVHQNILKSYTHLVSSGCNPTPTTQSRVTVQDTLSQGANRGMFDLLKGWFAPTVLVSILVVLHLLITSSPLA